MKRLLSLPSGGRLELGGRPLVMAVVNLTPDSFFPGSRAANAEEALEMCLRAEAEGADLIDLGAESSRPGGAYIEAEEETARLLPALKAFRKRSSLPVSIDTRKAGVARAALDEGADIINDISALTDDPCMGPVCGFRGAPVILMHKKGGPATMQDNPCYSNVIEEVRCCLALAAERAYTYGIPRKSVIVDPGVGFGKTTRDNLALIAGIPRLASLGYPLLLGLSRKSFIGELTGKDASGRLAGSLAAHAAAVLLGASIVRAHDVGETVEAVKTAWAIRQMALGDEVDA